MLRETLRDLETPGLSLPESAFLGFGKIANGSQRLRLVQIPHFESKTFETGLHFDDRDHHIPLDDGDVRLAVAKGHVVPEPTLLGIRASERLTKFISHLGRRADRLLRDDFLGRSGFLNFGSILERIHLRNLRNRRASGALALLFGFRR